MGYLEAGLEIWGYPFQILSSYKVGFRATGATAEVEGRLLLRRVDYDFNSVTRTYIGPDYLVRERFFVPLNQPAAIISYEVEGSRKLDIVVHFVPALNLMWPGAVGGQYNRWNADGPGFVLSEPEHGFSAIVGSPEISSHDDTVNSTVRPDTSLSFTLRPTVTLSNDSSATSKATVVVALNGANTKDPAAALHSLLPSVRQQEADVSSRTSTVQAGSLRVHTPDEEVNRDLAWAIAALDQAWVCNPLLGCGIVAGYGPSRDARRPQYDWFFAGDGLVATNALISAGEYTRAREELDFIRKYQEPTTGMIWHELSQSAGYIDWSKYPYMYVHVDISFDYLATVARYVSVTGDAAYAKEHWESIEAAYRYCSSLIGRTDHLPHIPADKEASDEQHRPADDLGLSAAWMSAASGYAQLAGLTGHTREGEFAMKEVQLTRASIPTHYWNAEKNFWLDGHTHAGEPIYRRALGPTNLILQNVFSPQQNRALLDQMTSADFQADWGSHEVAVTAKEYDPYSYGAGSVSALATTAAATTFWQAHRPESAFALWKAITQWNALDSPGHIHEVLAGNFYHEQTESVPEQTWSSAGLLDATARGLLGLEIDGIANTLSFAPHLPAEWKEISVRNVRLPHSTLAFTVAHNMTGLNLKIENDGPAIRMSFEPQIPLGAQALTADFQGRPIPSTIETTAGDEHASLSLDVPSGISLCHLSFRGGVSVSPHLRLLHVGDPSSDLKLVSVRLDGRMLSIEADVHSAGIAAISIITPWEIKSQKGVAVQSLHENEYVLDLDKASTGTPPQSSSGYRRVHAVVIFEPTTP